MSSRRPASRQMAHHHRTPLIRFQFSGLPPLATSAGDSPQILARNHCTPQPDVIQSTLRAGGASENRRQNGGTPQIAAERTDRFAVPHEATTEAAKRMGLIGTSPWRDVRYTIRGQEGSVLCAPRPLLLLQESKLSGYSSCGRAQQKGHLTPMNPNERMAVCHSATRGISSCVTNAFPYTLG